MFRRVRDLLKHAQSQPLLSRDDLNARGHLLLSSAHWARTWIARHEVDEYPRVAQRLVDFMLHGLRKPPTPGTSAALWTGAASACDGVPAMAADAGLVDENGHGDAYLRAATVLVNEQGYRGASVGPHLRATQRHQRIVLSPPPEQARPHRRVFRTQLVMPKAGVAPI